MLPSTLKNCNSDAQSLAKVFSAWGAAERSRAGTGDVSKVKKRGAGRLRQTIGENTLKERGNFRVGLVKAHTWRSDEGRKLPKNGYRLPSPFLFSGALEKNSEASGAAAHRLIDAPGKPAPWTRRVRETGG